MKIRGTFSRDKNAHFSSSWDITTGKVLLKYFHMFVFCSGRVFQQYIDNDNPTFVSGMAIKKSLLLNFIFLDGIYSLIVKVLFVIACKKCFFFTVKSRNWIGYLPNDRLHSTRIIRYHPCEDLLLKCIT